MSFEETMSWSTMDPADMEHHLFQAPARPRRIAVKPAFGHPESPGGAHRAAPIPAQDASLAARAASIARDRATARALRAHAFTVDRNWRVTAVSPLAAAWVGRDRSELIGRDARQDLLTSATVFAAVDAALATGQPSELLLRSMFRPGRWLEFQVEPTDGGASILFRDVTSEAASHAEAQAADAADPDRGGDCVEMALLDAHGVILSVNAAWRETFASLQSGGRTFGVGASYEDVCRRIIPDLDPGVLGQAMRHLLAGEVHTLTHAYVAVTPAGPRWRQIRILPLKDDVAHFIAVREGLTEAPRGQARLDQTTEQLRSAQQQERQRIAIELHDSTSHHLAALGLGVSQLRRLMGARENALGILDDMAASIDEAAKEIRVMSHLMKPPGLHRHGLEASTRRYAQGFGIRTGLNIVFRCDGRPACVGAAVQHAAFRVMQEALSNVHRHARARTAEVELAIGAAELTLRVADDGCGIAPLRQARIEGIPLGVGIPGMRSRVEHLGGRLDIASSRAGVTVTARIPLRPSGVSKAGPGP